MRIRRFLKNFLEDERGQSTTEYILILAVVVMVAMKFRQSFGSKLTKIVDILGGQIEQGIENPGY